MRLKSERKVIVKVQLSLASSDGQRMALAYNEDRSIFGEWPAEPHLKKLMRGKQKAFFYARMKGTILHVDKTEAPWQDW